MDIDQTLKQLNAHVHELITVATTLKSENQALKSEAMHWQQEHETLIHKTERARTKLESMISRLKKI